MKKINQYKIFYVLLNKSSLTCSFTWYWFVSIFIYGHKSC